MGVCSRYLTTLEVFMNAFFEHHQHSIRLAYDCFERLLLNGLIQPFKQPERVIGFFNTYREGKRVTRDLLHEIADQYKNWVTNRSQKWNAPILEAPKGRRDDFMDPYFKRAKPDEVVAILRESSSCHHSILIRRGVDRCNSGSGPASARSRTFATRTVANRSLASVPVVYGPDRFAHSGRCEDRTTPAGLPRRTRSV